MPPLPGTAQENINVNILNSTLSKLKHEKKEWKMRNSPMTYQHLTTTASQKSQTSSNIRGSIKGGNSSSTLPQYRYLGDGTHNSNSSSNLVSGLHPQMSSIPKTRNSRNALFNTEHSSDYLQGLYRSHEGSRGIQDPNAP
jgi:hypothetical protein